MKKAWILIVLLSGLLFQVTPTYATTDTTLFQSVEPLKDTTTFTNVVIFIRFSDEPTYTAPNTLSYYENMFNGVDQVSLRDYYLDVSYNQLTIDSYIITSNDQIVYFTDIYKRGYYQPYDAVSNPQGYETTTERNTREQTLLKRAIDFVDDNNLVPEEINLDANNDGAIDSISFLVSGEAGDWNVLLWPHKWELYYYYDYAYDRFETNAPSINGKYAFYYTFELLGNHSNYQYAVDVNIVAHETFHLFGTPDLYHYYDYFWIEPVGYWGLMESLSDPPAHMLGYMKFQYGGWIDTVNEITTNGTYTLYPMQDSPDNLYRIKTGYSNEYVYLEYRDDTGRYESSVPDSGLLVYRVDLDYLEDGNEDGYYDSARNPQNEVFIFRPGITDTTPPISFPPTDNTSIDEDGDIDQAALSQYNNYNEMGLDTDIIMFHSDGTLMNLIITNVVEHDGYITFDVQFERPDIIIETEYNIPSWDDVVLLDVDGTYYNAIFTGITSEQEVYYTTDGSEPSMSSTLYQGEQILVTIEQPEVRAIVVENGIIVDTLTRSFEFSSTVETAHNPYNASQMTYWLLHFEHLTEYDLYFNSDFNLNGPSDRFWVYQTPTNYDTYTNTELADTTLSSTTEDALFVFISDDVDNNAYGVNGSLTILRTFPVLGYSINGDSSMEINLDDTYVEYGINITGDETEEVYYTTTGMVDTTTEGTYEIIYTIYDGNDIFVDTLTRTVTVGDFTAPVITLVDSSVIYIDVFDSYLEPGATVTDNVSVSDDITITGTVDTSQIGTYILYYSVSDDAGNQSDIIERTIVVEDHIAPTLRLNYSVDTLFVGDQYTDQGAHATDNYDNQVTIEVLDNTVDTTIAGQYYILYKATDSSDNVSYYYRYVYVIERVNPTIICTVGVMTYEAGQDFEPMSCTFDQVEAQVDTVNLDMSTPGTYEITYYAVINEERFEYRSYVFVLEQTILDTTAILPTKEEEIV